MTFQQHINSLQLIINHYGLTVNKKDNGNDEVRGNINGRRILISISYNTNSIYWVDTNSLEQKQFNY